MVYKNVFVPTYLYIIIVYLFILNPVYVLFALLHVLRASVYSFVMMFGGAESPNEEAQPNEPSLYSGHWWSSDMTVDQTPALPLKSFGTVVDSSGSLI